MKKFLAAVLSLTIMLGMNVNAYAGDEVREEGTLVLSTTIHEPSYTLTVPREPVSLSYGNTNIIEIGTISSSDEINLSDLMIKCSYTNLININNRLDKIDLKLYLKVNGKENPEELNKDGIFASTYATPTLYTEYSAKPIKNSYMLCAQVPDWSKAKAGQTYEATVTYKVTVSSPLITNE